MNGNVGPLPIKKKKVEMLKYKLLCYFSLQLLFNMTTEYINLFCQVICTKCSKVSNQYENMMDLTVEIHGDAASLEECLDQFTAREWLHGENMYKCDG